MGTTIYNATGNPIPQIADAPSPAAGYRWVIMTADVESIGHTNLHGSGAAAEGASINHFVVPASIIGVFVDAPTVWCTRTIERTICSIFDRYV